MLKDARRDVTFRMTLRAGDVFILDGGDYTVVVDDTTKRYASEKSGILVEVNGCRISIQSTAWFLRRSGAAGTNEKCCYSDHKTIYDVT
ncbi:hypothetical protein AAVH_29268 [Aphelenchoides avenae]|nr:hypothetical protein AAVH_29268 [Aphelenchus avenae]